MSDAGKGWHLLNQHHLGLTVSDIERSIEFYRDVLGMELVGRRPCVEQDYVGRQTGYPGLKLSVASFRACAGNAQSIEMVQYLTEAGAAADPSTNRAGNSHLCLRVDDLRAAHADLSAQGVRFKSAPVEITHGPNRGGLVVYLHDPDGYTLELFQPAEG
tara:strand:- start:363 stop:839 length:477 start_codon:yes stop_codon:yes gene_type:complete